MCASQGPVKKCTILAQSFTTATQVILHGGLKSTSPNTVVKIIYISFTQEAFDSYFKNLVIAL